MSDLDRLALAVLLPGFAGARLGAGPRGLFAEGLGGLCLYGANTAAGPESVADLVAALPDGTLVAVDEEGGDVTRLHARDGSPVLGALALGAIDDPDLTRTVGRAVGDELAGLGITLALAPVADVNTRAANPVIGTRSFGTDPVRVAAHVAAWTEGLQESGVAACVKHWPGHGDTDLDSHLALPRLGVAADVLAGRELVPFAAAVRAGARAVMTSHIVVAAWDADLPATLSAAALAPLREQLGFTGAVVSDALDMAGASAGRGIPEAAVLALVAGCDLLCLGPGSGDDDADVALVRAVQRALVDAVRAGRIPEARLEQAAARVSSVAASGTTPPVPSQTPSGDAVTRSVTVEGTLPDLHGGSVVRIDSPGTIAVGDVPWGLPVDATYDDLPGGPLVVQVRDAHRQPHVVEALDRVAGRDAVVVEWGWPGPATTDLPRICARGWSQPGREVVTGLLREAGLDR